MTDLPGLKPMKPSQKDLGKAVAAMKEVAEQTKKPVPGMSGPASRGNKVAAKAPPIC